MFAALSGRQYVLVIALQHLPSDVHFLFFHRGGLTSYPIFDLTTQDGFAMFVSAMVGLASVNHRVPLTRTSMVVSVLESMKWGRLGLAHIVISRWMMLGWNRMLHIGKVTMVCTLLWRRSAADYQSPEPPFLWCFW